MSPTRYPFTLYEKPLASQGGARIVRRIAMAVLGTGLLATFAIAMAQRSPPKTLRIEVSPLIVIERVVDPAAPNPDLPDEAPATIDVDDIRRQVLVVHG